MTPADEAAFWQRVVSAIDATERRLAERFLSESERAADAWEALDALVDLSFVYQARAGAMRHLRDAQDSSLAWDYDKGQPQTAL